MGLWSKLVAVPATFEDEVQRIQEFQAYLAANSFLSKLEERGIAARFTEHDGLPPTAAVPVAAAEAPAAPPREAQAASPQDVGDSSAFEDAASNAAEDSQHDSEGVDVEAILAPASTAAAAATHDLSPVTLLRFLRARAFQFGAAQKLLEKSLIWRGAVRPEAIAPAEIQTPIDSGVWTFLGRSKCGRPILLVNAGLWKPEHYPIETYVKFVSFFLNDAERQIDRRFQEERAAKGANNVPALSATEMELQRFVLVIDMGEWKVYHANYTRYVMQLVKIVQDQFPERLHVAFILNSPTIFWAVWKVLSPLVQERTRNKLKWMSVPKVAPGEAKTAKCAALETILAEIDEGVWPARYGGGLADVDIAVPNIQGVANVKCTPYNASDTGAGAGLGDSGDRGTGAGKTATGEGVSFEQASAVASTSTGPSAGSIAQVEQVV